MKITNRIAFATVALSSFTLPAWADVAEDEKKCVTVPETGMQACATDAGASADSSWTEVSPDVFVNEETGETAVWVQTAPNEYEIIDDASLDQQQGPEVPLPPPPEAPVNPSDPSPPNQPPDVPPPPEVIEDKPMVFEAPNHDYAFDANNWEEDPVVAHDSPFGLTRIEVKPPSLLTLVELELAWAVNKAQSDTPCGGNEVQQEGSTLLNFGDIHPIIQISEVETTVEAPIGDDGCPESFWDNLDGKTLGDIINEANATYRPFWEESAVWSSTPSSAA
jgi:hypothetical protein